MWFFTFKLAWITCLRPKWAIFIVWTMLFGCFGGPFGLIFFLVGRQILKPINTITGKFVWKVNYIYVCTRVHVWVHQSELARRGELEHDIGCTWVETAWGALCRQVLRSQACEAEENLSAKCTECSFNPNVNYNVAKYLDVELARKGVLGLPLELTLGWVRWSAPPFLEYFIWVHRQ